MSTYTIKGGTPLYGSVSVGGAKNASYKLMIAALLASSPSRLLNFSHISDVELVAGLIRHLGGAADQIGSRAYMIDPLSLKSWQIPAEHGEASRASTLFMPVLLKRFGRAEVPFPGGDKIGKRPLDWHFAGLEALGVKIVVDGQMIVATTNGLVGTTYRFPKNSHTGTETLIVAAAMAKGKTVLENAAEETEVDDLISFLNSMGADIKRTAPRTITIQGVDRLQGSVYKIMPDHNQVITFACAALATKGDVVVENARKQDLESFLEKVTEIGGGYEVGNYGIRFYYKGALKGCEVTTAIHPGFKTDWQPLWVTMMTQAQGESILHETVHSNRFKYVSELKKMGATIELFNPEVSDPEKLYNFQLNHSATDDYHAARITGPSALVGGEFTVKDLRHGATLMVAGLIAEGTTVLHDPEHHIDRGYEWLDQQLVAMGAAIVKSA